MRILGKQDREISLAALYQNYQLDSNKVPQHVAIVMDGNGRWAKKRVMPRTMGHKAGAEAFRRAIQAGVKFGVHYLSVYVFSTENWSRPPEEVGFLMNLLKDLILKEAAALKKEGIRMRCLGDLSRLDPSIQNDIRAAEADTASGTVLQVNLMLNYGARMELIHACRSMASEVLAGNMTVADITEQRFSQALYTGDIPDPDIFIRTGGDVRISNFMLWQCAYAELFFLQCFWPDFDETHFVAVLKQFQGRERRFGGVI